MSKKIGIVSFEDFLGKKNIGSTRLRVHWALKYWQDAELYQYAKKYDAIIFQKAYWIDYAKNYEGVKILDLCDPDWMHWSFNVVEMLKEVDGVSCSSLELAKQVAQFTDKPVAYIPDMVDFEELPKPKEHVGETKKVAWFGYQQNFPVLASAIPALLKRKLGLIVISDKPMPIIGLAKKLEIEQYSHHPDTWLTDIQKADVVLNPKFDKGKWKFKSTNKTVTAWALGMPVAETDRELDALMTEEARKTEAEKRFKEAKDGYDVRNFSNQMNEFIQYICSTTGKKSPFAG